MPMFWQTLRRGPVYVCVGQRATARHVLFQRLLLAYRPYSSRLVTSPQTSKSDQLIAVSVHVPCRSAGSITIDVFRSSTPASPVLIYLPSGPIVPDRAEEEDRIIAALKASSEATIARINYRASPQHPYPTPIHDVMQGFDWVRENLLRDEFSRPVLARMGVCGELVGGSLAVMLALTECRLGESRIGAVSVNNPIVDWVLPDDLPVVAASELPEPLSPEDTALAADDDPMSSTILEKHVEPTTGRKSRKRAPKPPPPTAWQLYGNNTVIPTVTMSGERDVLFRKPEHYFDRFASPIHFFRSPHGALIYPQDDDSFASAQPISPIDLESQMDISHFQSFEESPRPLDLPTLARCRAYARIYPPAGVNLTLPAWHISTGSQSPLLDQASELAKMARRSIARQTLKSRSGRIRWHDDTEKEKYKDYADSRVHLDTTEGVGLWTEQETTADWKVQIEKVAAWMKENLKPGFV